MVLQATLALSERSVATVRPPVRAAPIAPVMPPASISPAMGRPTATAAANALRCATTDRVLSELAALSRRPKGSPPRYATSGRPPTVPAPASINACPTASAKILVVTREGARRTGSPASSTRTAARGIARPDLAAGRPCWVIRARRRSTAPSEPVARLVSAVKASPPRPGMQLRGWARSGHCRTHCDDSGRQKSPTIALNSLGRSRLLRWPAPGITASLAPGMAS